MVNHYKPLLIVYIYSILHSVHSQQPSLINNASNVTATATPTATSDTKVTSSDNFFVYFTVVGVVLVLGLVITAIVHMRHRGRSNPRLQPPPARARETVWNRLARNISVRSVESLPRYTESATQVEVDLSLPPPAYIPATPNTTRAPAMTTVITPPEPTAPVPLMRSSTVAASSSTRTHRSGSLTAHDAPQWTQALKKAQNRKSMTAVTTAQPWMQPRPTHGRGGSTGDEPHVMTPPPGYNAPKPLRRSSTFGGMGVPPPSRFDGSRSSGIASSPTLYGNRYRTSPSLSATGSEPSPRMRPLTLGEAFSLTVSPTIAPVAPESGLVDTFSKLHPDTSNAEEELVALFNEAVEYVKSHPIPPQPEGSKMPAWNRYKFPILDAAAGAQQASLVVTENGRNLKFRNRKGMTMSRIATFPFPSPQHFQNMEPPPTYFYQAHILRLPVNSNFSIGLATYPFPATVLPGRARTSIGYHSRTGRKYLSNPYDDGYEYATTFAEGDVVGCAYQVRDGLVFFTKNGRVLGVAAVGWGLGTEQIWACVGMEGRGEVHMEFGWSQP